MKIKLIKIKNFRNFDDIEFKTSKKNIVIGLNDVGKTNLLYALRIVFDYQIRNKELIETDFFKSNTTEPLEIEVVIDINDENKDENDKVLAKIGNLNAIGSTSGEFHIKYKCKFEEEESLEWCIKNEDELPYVEIPRQGLNQTKLDKIFKPMYIDSQMKFDMTMKEFKRKALKEFGEENFSERTSIDEKIGSINTDVALLNEVQSLQMKIANELSELNTDFTPVIKSNIAIEGLHNSLEVYTKYDGDDENAIYPTAGDGKRKLVEYAMKNSLIKLEENSKYIPIIFIEEPENHLHLSVQIQLLNVIKDFEHCFISTHSPELLYSIPEDMNIVRLSRHTNSISANSSVFVVPEEFNVIRHKYQKELVSAMFYETVFLVEGYSEKLIWDRALDLFGENKNNKFILNIIGTNFKPYYKFLTELGIKTYVRTDNDLKHKPENKTELSGFNRLRELEGETTYDDIDIRVEVLGSNATKKKLLDRWKISKRYYRGSSEIINSLNNEHLYLAEIDFENDVVSVLKNSESLERIWKDVKMLRNSKWHALIDTELGKEILSADGMHKIIQSPKFKGLKRFLDE